MPSVAMKGGTLSLATITPLTKPHSAPNPMAAAMPRPSGRPQYVSTTPAITAQKVIIVPTDRSMPAVMMTKVQATASTPLTAVACRMATRLSVCKKFGEARLKKLISASRLAKASSFWRVAGLGRNRRLIRLRAGSPAP